MSVPGGWEAGSDALWKRGHVPCGFRAFFGGAFVPSAGVGDAPRWWHGRMGPNLRFFGVSALCLTNIQELCATNQSCFFYQERPRLCHRWGTGRDLRGHGSTTARLKPKTGGKKPNRRPCLGKDCAQGGCKPAPRHQQCSLCLAFRGAGLGFAALQCVLCGFFGHFLTFPGLRDCAAATHRQ